MSNLKQIVIAKLADAESRLAALDVDADTAKSIVDAWPDIDDGVEAWASYYEQNADAIHANNLVGEIKGLKETLNADLARPQTRYVITDGKLVSPAGFTCESGVYIRNELWIETDRKPRHWSGNCYDMEKVRQQMGV